MGSSIQGNVTGTNVYVKIPNTDFQREIRLLNSGDINEFAPCRMLRRGIFLCSRKSYHP